ncbi:MAG: tetratricopeptide repeat protein [Candidatus Tectomicrobia bacterium]|nr:tetratricopeptide repeat protein [Candidatus Tectomicrobia bacterium]
MENVEPGWRRDARGLWLLAGLVFALTLLVYLRSLGNGFTNWDDEVYVTENPFLGVPSLASLKAVFTSFYFTEYLPVHLLSFFPDRLLWGFAPFGYHLTSVLLHSFDAALVYVLLARLVGAGGIALLGALWFGLHPMQVESVAWIAERKTVLSQAFLLAAFLAYESATRQPPLRRGCYAAALLLATLALLSKSTAVPLPLILVAYHLLLKRPRVGLTAPFFVLAGAASVTTMLSHSAAGAVLPSYYGGSLGATLITVPVLLVTYPAKLLLPVQLNAYYDARALGSVLQVRFLIALLGLAAILLLIRALLRANRTAVFGLAWFFLALLPVLNLVPIPILLAERFVYLPAVGVAILGASVASHLAAAWRQRAAKLERRVALLGCLGLALLAVLTISRIGIWHDSATLWRDTTRKSPRTPIPHINMGRAYRDAGLVDRAVAENKLALSSPVQLEQAVTNLAMAYLKRRQPEKAVAALRRFLATQPQNTGAHITLATAYLQTHLSTKAAAEILTALQINPQTRGASNNLAVAYLQLNLPKKAEPHLRAALRARPLYPAAQVNLGVALVRQGELARALPELRKGLHDQPGNANGHTYLAAAYLGLGRGDKSAAASLRSLSLHESNAVAYTNLAKTRLPRREIDRAILETLRALRLRPTFAPARTYRGVAYLTRGLVEKAVNDFQIALRADPSSLDARANLGVAYLRLGAFEAALAEFRTVARQNPGNPVAHTNLGLAYLNLNHLSKAAAELAVARWLDPAVAAARELEVALRQRLGKGG